MYRAAKEVFRWFTDMKSCTTIAVRLVRHPRIDTEFEA